MEFLLPLNTGGLRKQWLLMLSGRRTERDPVSWES